MCPFVIVVGKMGMADEMFCAMYEVEWSPRATSNLYKECEMGDVWSSLASAFLIILFPVELNHTMRGSVRVLVPAPLDSGDLLVSSCKASEAAMNTESSGKDGSRRLMSNGIRGVKWLRRKKVGP